MIKTSFNDEKVFYQVGARSPNKPLDAKGDLIVAGKDSLTAIPICNMLQHYDEEKSSCVDNDEGDLRFDLFSMDTG